jgi:ubiquinone/menaquinone biosynthesis C-methylase UbiE
VSTLQTITGHYFNKHEVKNPLLRLFVNSYKRNFCNTISELSFDSVMEIGSGEGYIITYLIETVEPKLVIASDIDLRLMKRYSWKGVIENRVVCRGELLPVPSKSFDLVLACEVLEHVKTPSEIVREMARISKEWVFVTVPLEPYWRLLNILRGKYISRLGNTPGHVRHFSIKGIVNLLSIYLSISNVRVVFPWIFVLCQKDRK